MSIFKDKVLLITGGTGSFGNAVLRRFLDSDIKEIRIFSRDEKKQDDMRHHQQNPKVKFYIGNVRDRQSVDALTARFNLICLGQFGILFRHLRIYSPAYQSTNNKGHKPPFHFFIHLYLFFVLFYSTLFHSTKIQSTLTQPAQTTVICIAFTTEGMSLTNHDNCKRFSFVYKININKLTGKQTLVFLI